MEHWSSKNLTIKNFKKILISVLLLFIVFLILDFFIAPVSFTDNSINVKVSEGDNLRKVLGNINSNGINFHKNAFIVTAKILGRSNLVQKGVYEINSSDTKFQILKKLNSGDVKIVKFQIKDGETFLDLIKRIALSDYFTHEMNISDNLSNWVEKIGIKNKNKSAEGLLYADTYHIQMGTSDVDFLKNASEEFNSRSKEIWNKRCDNISYKNFYQSIILASIIEKESAIEEEKPLIAGVYNQRLKIWMHLQADPTVIYGLRYSYDDPKLTKRDLQTKTPYNTYMKYGLPPTPISMISLASLEAAVCPDDKEGYLYFVASGNGDRGHKFSKSLKEHNVLVKEYLENIKN